MSKSSSYDKSFYKKPQNKLFNLFMEKKLIKILIYKIKKNDNIVRITRNTISIRTNFK